MKNLISVITLFISLSSFAAVQLKVLKPVEVLGYDLGVGSRIQLTTEEDETLTGLYLGRMAEHPDRGDEVLFLNERTGKVLLVDTESIRFSKKNSMQVLISTVDQAGDTCAAYAVFHFWQQFSLWADNESLKTSFSTERSRMKFLEESITSYYMGRDNSLKRVLNKFAKSFDYKCGEKSFEDGAEAADFVFETAASGSVVLMEFDIGPKMVRSLNPLKDHETGEELDDRLWIPRKVGERSSSGHAIVAAAAFEFKGKRKLVVLDSNWNEPRVWDADDYFGGKTAIDEMIFHSCH